MKKTFLYSLFLIASLSGEIRTWTSADGTKTFEGEVTAYDIEKKTVTAKINGSAVTFNESKLSEADLEFLSTWKPEEELSSALTDLIAKDKLSRFSGKKFATTELEKKPEFYLLYYSASW